MTSLPATSAPTQPFFGALESLRGIAALIVVIYHLPPWHAAFYDVQVIRHGYLMVNFFFVLSGFVLFHSYGQRIATGAAYLKFAALRLGRLYPVHILFVLPFLLIELGKYRAFTHGASMASSPSLAKIGNTLLANLLLLQGLGFTSNDPAFNFPNWSISTEFYAYLIFGAVVLFFSGRAFVAVSLLLVTTCVSAVLLYAADLGEHANMLRCIAGFFIGCLTRVAFGRVLTRRLSFDWPAVVAALCLVGMSLHWKAHIQGGSWYEMLAYPLSALLILSLLLTPKSRLNRLLLSRPLRFLGEISYSLYLCHALVQWCARQTCRALFKRPEITIDGINATPLSFSEALVAVSGVLGITLLLGWLTYRWVEAPARDASRRHISAFLTARSAEPSA